MGVEAGTVDEVAAAALLMLMLLTGQASLAGLSSGTGAARNLGRKVARSGARMTGHLL